MTYAILKTHFSRNTMPVSPLRLTTAQIRQPDPLIYPRTPTVMKLQKLNIGMSYISMEPLIQVRMAIRNLPTPTYIHQLRMDRVNLIVDLKYKTSH